MTFKPGFIHCFLAIFIAAGSPAISCASETIVVDRIIATVGVDMITVADYRIFAKGMSDSAQSEEIDMQLLKNMIEEKIMLQEAVSRGIAAEDWEVDMMIEESVRQSGFSGEDIESLLSGDGISPDSYRKMMRERIIVSKLIEDDVDSRVIVANEEIAGFYRSNIDMFLQSPEKMEIKAIFLKLGEAASVTEITDLKLKALKISGLLKDGDSFDRLVDEYSDEPLKGHAGMLGQFARGAMVPELDRAAFSLKDGQTSEPVWVSEGAYILQSVRRVGESFKPLDEVKNEIADKLRKTKRDKLFNEWLKTLWDKSSVTINQS